MLFALCSSSWPVYGPAEPRLPESAPLYVAPTEHPHTRRGQHHEHSLISGQTLNLVSLVRTWRWPSYRPFVEVSMLIFVSDIAMSFIGDRPIRNSALFFLWLGVMLLLLPVAYG